MRMGELFRRLIRAARTGLRDKLNGASKRFGTAARFSRKQKSVFYFREWGSDFINGNTAFGFPEF